jgi:hypothetical protein
MSGFKYSLLTIWDDINVAQSCWKCRKRRQPVAAFFFFALPIQLQGFQLNPRRNSFFLAFGREQLGEEE